MMPHATRHFFLLGSVVACVLAAGCGEAKHCGETSTPVASSKAPVITNFDLEYQVEEDPWQGIFSLSFTDSNGNLGSGVAEFFVQGTQTESLNLQDLFLAAGVSPTATEGTIALPLRFADTIAGNARSWLGIQLVDAEQERSNCYALELTLKPEDL